MTSYFNDRKLYEKSSLTPTQKTQEFLNRIEENKDINAFITVCNEVALKQAAESDKRFKDGNPRKLEGMVVAVKDNISTKGIQTTCASKILGDYNPVYDATSVERLQSEGAIIIGKTNMDEFAMGSSNENSAFGNVLNPLNKEYVPGGSSGGSAAAVAGDFCHISLGSETGGSVRQPASFTNTYGYKPSYGRLSRYGLVAFGSSFDQIGVFSNNVEDMSLALDVMTGEDKNDATCLQKPPMNSFEILENDIQDLSIGIIDDEVLKYADFETIRIYQESIAKLEKAGHSIKVIDFPMSQAWIPIYYIIATAEASSNLSRFDGMRYGFRAEVEDGEDLITATRSQGFGDEVKRRILLGTYVLSEGHHDKFYVNALKARRFVYNNYKSIFSEVDCIFLPTTPSPGFKFNAKKDNPLAMYMSDIYTASANLAGVPAISIPVGKCNNTGQPIGLQIQANNFEDDKLIHWSKKFSDIL